MEITIYCDECTKQARLKDKYAVTRFKTLTDAFNHIMQYGHSVRIELEEDSNGD